MALPSGSADLENCPVSEELLKKLLGTTLNAVAEISNQLSDEQRATLAVYCYRRSHFRRLGLSLAAQCNRQALIREAGHAGELIFAQSQMSGSTPEDMNVRPRGTKAPVSLHTV